MYTCAYCAVHACAVNQPEKMPKNCPMRNGELMEEALNKYSENENRDFYIKSCEIEAAGYGEWTRLRETVEFARSMGYKKLGLAFCRGLCSEAKTVAEILRKAGFETVSVICKTGGVDKEYCGIPNEHKVKPGSFEAMCNPIAQAMLLNEQETEFNIVLGLCVGHDSLFYKYSKAPVTTLVTKDRVTGNNAAAAIYCAGSYFKKKLY